MKANAAEQTPTSPHGVAISFSLRPSKLTLSDPYGARFCTQCPTRRQSGSNSRGEYALILRRAWVDALRSFLHTSFHFPAPRRGNTDCAHGARHERRATAPHDFTSKAWVQQKKC
ncbi:hypothetical protein TRVL_09598 [Trypanosoma vivax]|nr:hypothetical protein TRVL_09598 [Trypanosoma vivax]